MVDKTRVLIMWAAGRDSHNFNPCCRDNEACEAETEAGIIHWDGGNNDLAFCARDLCIAVADVAAEVAGVFNESPPSTQRFAVAFGVAVAAAGPSLSITSGAHVGIGRTATLAGLDRAVLLECPPRPHKDSSGPGRR